MSAWPCSTATVCPVAASQRRTVVSSLPEAIREPSDDQSMPTTTSVCPLSVRQSRVATFQTRTTHSWLEEDTLPLAVLAAGFAALVLYLLSMVCLVVLRRREPGLFHAYRAPLPRL